MIDLKELITGDILYSNSWTEDKYGYDCTLYVTKEKIYYSKRTKDSHYHTAYPNRAISSLGCGDGSGTHYYVLFYRIGSNTVEKFEFPHTPEGEILATEIFRAISDAIN